MTFQSLQKEAYQLTDKEIRSLRFQVLINYREALRKTQKKIDKVYKDILDGVDPDKYYDTMLKGNRLMALYNEIEEIYNRQLIIINSNITEASELSFINQYYRQQYITAWFLPLVPYSADFSFIDNLAVEMSVYGTESKWKQLKKQYTMRDKRVKKLSAFRVEGDRPTLKHLLRSNNRRVLNKIKDTITQGLITGQSNNQMSILLRSMNNSFGKNADRIIRTETHRNLTASQFLHNENLKERGVKVRRMILAVLDGRTREQSGTVDGRMENEEGYFKYPRGIMVRYAGNSGIPEWDINDRETTIQVINGVKPKTRNGLNPVTGQAQLASWRSFNDWMDDNGLTRNKSGKIIKK